MNRNNVEEIKARIPIEDLIGSYVKLEKSGKSYKARCPFHNEKSASFFVSPDRGGYYCFGCNAKGDIFSFVEQFEGLDFRGALKILAERAGVKLVHDEKSDGERDRLYKVMELATAYFEEQLEKSAEAREYVKSRGITDETRRAFRIGWAPEGWRNLMTYLKGKGFNEAVMEKVGLIKAKENEEGRTKQGDSNYYDRFRGRIMFPISDSSGRVIAFTGRILKSDTPAGGSAPAKYLNSPDSPLFDKSLILYGLDKAKSEIRRLNYTIFVEGQMDLVMSHQAGIKNTVASSGTALSEETNNSVGIISNLGLVRRLSSNVVIAFDSDSAGRKAALRAAGIALSLGMDVKIADIVGGKDPADLVKEDVEKWRQTLKEAKPVIAFELDNVVREHTYDVGGKLDPRKLTKAVTERVLPLVARIESSSDQSHFVAMIADQAKLPMDAVWQDVRVVAKRLKDAEIAANPTSANQNSAANTFTSPRNTIVKARTTSEMGKRVDLIERRLFGLLSLMEKEKVAGVDAYKEQIKKMAGDGYDARLKTAEENKSDIMFEAESFFGTDAKAWEKPMKELLINFEMDMISEEIVATMHELKMAEKAGDHTRVAELAKKCQVLSIRKAEVGKKG